MTTRRTHLERFSLHYGGDEDKQDVHFESDPDLSVKLAKGDVFDGPGLSESSGLVVVALDFDGGPYAVVKVDRHGTRVEDVEVLDQAIEHLEGLRDTLRDVEQADDLPRVTPRGLRAGPRRPGRGAASDQRSRSLTYPQIHSGGWKQPQQHDRVSQADPASHPCIGRPGLWSRGRVHRERTECQVRVRRTHAHAASQHAGSAAVGVIVGSLTEADVYVVLVVGGGTTRVGHRSPPFAGSRDGPDPLVPDDVRDVELPVVALGEPGYVAALVRVRVHHEVRGEAFAVVTRRGLPVTVDRTHGVPALHDPRGPGGVRTQAPGFGAGTARVGEVAHLEGVRRCVRGGGRRSGDGGEKGESEQGGGDAMGDALGTGSTG